MLINERKNKNDEIVYRHVRVINLINHINSHDHFFFIIIGIIFSDCLIFDIYATFYHAEFDTRSFYYECLVIVCYLS